MSQSLDKPPQEVEDKYQLLHFFQEIWCVSLSRRKDRWEQFLEGLPKDWPFICPRVYHAIDGKLCKPPEWWRSGSGAWGCYRSHLSIIESCLNRNVSSVLLLEDDAIFLEDFTQKVKQFLEAVPNDWEMIYLGGQHLFATKHPPVTATCNPQAKRYCKSCNSEDIETSGPDHQPIYCRSCNSTDIHFPTVYQPFNVNRTHAFALHTPKFIRKIYHHLLRKDWHPRNHIDHHLGRLVQRREDKIYCPAEWLVGQRRGLSDVKRDAIKPENYWPSSASLDVPYQDLPFIIVLGTHSSGTSCCAGILHHLGIHMGNIFVGYYGNDPEKLCGFEAIGLTNICKKAINFSEANYSVTYKKQHQKIQSAVTEWINQKKREAHSAETIAGGKHPLICRLGGEILDATSDTLLVIHTVRPIEDSIKSMIRRSAKRNPMKAKSIESHMHWLNEGKLEFLNHTPKDKVLDVPYYDLLDSPSKYVDDITQFLGIGPYPHQLEKAINYVKPDQCHIRGTQ